MTDDRRPLRIEYVEKRNRKPATDWVARHFSEQPVEWDSDLSDSERELVFKGRYEAGMSREALFLAIGYPPASLSPDPAAPLLLHQVKRFNKVAFHFDAAGRLEQIRN